MKRKLLIILGCAIALVVVSLFGLSYLASRIFGERVEVVCSTHVVDSIPIGDGSTTVTVEDGLCNGWVVYGAYKVILRYRDHDRPVEVQLLAADNMQSDSKAPRVKMLTSHDLLITAQKEMNVDRGPSAAAGIRITYDIH
jgi:hypothetical protein